MPLEISGMTEKALVFTRSLDGGHSFGMVNPQFPFSYGTQIQSINGISSYRLAYGSWPFINASVNSFPSMCVDKSEGPNRGNIYVVWAEHAYDSINSHFLDEIDIYLIYSKDRGDSWSNRIRINTTPDEAENKHSFCPWICCDDETGTLSVIFYDDRDDDVLNGFVNAYVAMSRDYGLTWQNSRISDYNFTSSDPEYGSPFYFGIHNAISTKNALSYPVWTDSRLEVYGGEFYPVACQPELYTSPFYMWNCVDHYQNITEFVPSWKIREWEVSGYITAENTIDVNGLTVFNAGDSIVLLPSQDPTNPQGGFWSKNGSYLHAYIEGCQQFPQNSKSISLYDQDGYHQLGKSNKKVVSSENLIIFPNPCDGKFRVRLDNGSDLNCTIEIINSSGMSIYSGYFSNQSALNIDISSQPKGIYLIKVCTKDSTFVKKIVYQ